MRAIEVDFDEDLLARLDRTEEVRTFGRSEVVQRATSEYLERRCKDSEDEIDAQYQRAYAGGAGLGPEFEGWEDEGAWPSE